MKEFKYRTNIKNINISKRIKGMLLVPQPRCKICGRFYKPQKQYEKRTGNTVKLCLKCRKKYVNAGNYIRYIKIRNKRCLTCNKILPIGNRNKYCSKECNQKATRQKIKKYIQRYLQTEEGKIWNRTRNYVFHHANELEIGDVF